MGEKDKKEGYHDAKRGEDKYSGKGLGKFIDDSLFGRSQKETDYANGQKEAKEEKKSKK